MIDDGRANDATGGRGVDTPQPRDRRIVTVLFADIVGSTRMIEHADAETAVSILHGVLKTISEAITHHGGIVIQRMGDGLLAAFGVPIAAEDHAIRACHAGQLIQNRLGEHARELKAKYDISLRVRVGLNSGQVVVSTVARGGQIFYEVGGPTVHLAQRIETQTPPGAVGLSSTTYDRVRHVFDCTALGVRTLKGFAEPQPIYQVVGARKNPSERDPIMPDTTAPLVGRSQQLLSITRAIAEAKGGRGGLLVITGEAGIGKSRLLDEARDATSREVTWLEGNTLSFSQRISYWPFIEILRPVLGLSERNSEAENWNALERDILDLFGPLHVEVLPYIATLLGMEVRGTYAEQLRHVDPEVLGSQVFRAARRLFEQLAKRRPLVIAFEDLHWADRSSFALLMHLLPLATEVPILFCVLSRPDSGYLPQLRDAATSLLSRGYQEISLLPLSVEESKELIGSILGDHDSARRMRDLILYKAEGNPFFIEEIVRALVEQRVIVQENGTRRWATQSQEIVIPDTIQGVVMSRVDRLDDRLKDVLGIAAVIGRTFFYRILRAITAPHVEIKDPLAKLEAVELIDEMKSAPELAYLFRHALAHEAIYENLLRDKRSRLHGRVAECLAHLYVDRLNEIASLLAFHYARAENWEKALEYLLLAAEQSGRMAADGEALAHYEEAVAIYGRALGAKWDKVQRATIDRRLGEIYFRRGDDSKATEYFFRALAQFGDRLPTARWAIRIEIALELCVQLKHVIWDILLPRAEVGTADPKIDAHARPYEVLGWIYFLSDQELFLLDVLKAANLVARTANYELLAKSFAAIGLAFLYMGCRRIAYWYLSRGAQTAERSNLATQAFVRHLMGAYYWCCGRWAEAQEIFRINAPLSEKAGVLEIWADDVLYSCVLFNERGELHCALAQAEALVKMGTESAFQPALRWGLAARAMALRRLGRLSEARPIFEEALRSALAAHDIAAGALVAGDLCLLLVELGLAGDAEQILDDILRRIQKARLRVYSVANVYIGIAEIRLKRLAATSTGKARRRREARRACAVVLSMSRIYRSALIPGLRLHARFACLCGHRSKAEHTWLKAIAAAETLGARYELALTHTELGDGLGSDNHRQEGQRLISLLRNKPTDGGQDHSEADCFPADARS